MELSELLAGLRQTPSFMRQVTEWRTLPARPPRFAPYPPALDRRLIDALAQQGIGALYTHQAAAVSAALAGRHLVVVTPTASGKTLCYNLPVLQTLLGDPRARALYLFPTKALAQDQLHELRALIGRLGHGPAVHTYDGDTAAGARPAIRKDAGIIITNPDMLHTGILPHHTRWAELFQNLRYVVIDELHNYRGVFGSHVANVLRRLQRIAAFYGSRPQFIASSATIANPKELAEALTEQPMTLIDDDGSPKGEKHIIFYNPPIVNRALGIRRPIVLEARDLAVHFLRGDVQSIIFGRSRLTVEILVTYLRQAAAGLGLAAEDVRGYRGGYLPAERRAIEAGLRQGDVRAVVATNALELGIDIGQLSVAILAGYPGTIASAWQQAGRAGRRAGVSAALFVAGASPLDQYIISHPDYFFGRSPERGLIAPDNLAIVLSHLQCAAFELPFEDGELLGQFAETQDVLSVLAEEGRLRHSAGRWHWMSESYPAQSVSLRAAGADTFIIEDISDAEAGPRAIGELERASVPLLLHEGAIYIHEGQPYLVESLDWDGAIAHVRPAAVDYYTEAGATSAIQVTAVLASGAEGRLRKGYGQATVRTKATSYKKVQLYTHEILGRGPIDLPEIVLSTSAFWLAFPPALIESLQEAGAWQGEPLRDYGPNWEQQRALARARDGYRCQACGQAELPGRQHEVHHLRPFREFGYRRGVNDAYLQANELSNLVTLCHRCHQLTEAGRQLRSTLAGLAHIVRHVAPLFLMCDPRDLGVIAESSGEDGMPTLYIYDGAPAGLGFSRALFELPPGLLLRGAADVVRACGCAAGCPACVGPAGELSGDVKGQVVRLVEAVLAGAPQAAGEEVSR